VLGCLVLCSAALVPTFIERVCIFEDKDWSKSVQYHALWHVASAYSIFLLSQVLFVYRSKPFFVKIYSHDGFFLSKIFYMIFPCVIKN
jgi:hypothetical protein